MLGIAERSAAGVRRGGGGLQAKETSAVSSTFSGAAFLALAQGGRTGIERIANEQLREQKKLSAKMDEQIRASKDLAKRLTVA